MRGRILFILGITTFVVLVFFVEYNKPKRFVWTPTFSRYDKQPFGCAVFDEVVSDAWPGEWAVSRETFYQLTEDSVNYAVLAIAQNMNLSKTDVDALLELAGRGSKIMLAATSYSQVLMDTLHFKCWSSYFSAQGFRKYVGDTRTRSNLYWVGDTSRYASRTFHFFPQLHSSFFSKRDSLSTSLAEVHASKEIVQWSNGVTATDSIMKADSVLAPVAISMSVGKGEIILVSTPLLFTNYGVLDGTNATYVLRLLSRMNDLPFLRTEVYGSPSVEPQSPLRYFLSQRPLQWAVYVALITLLLFMGFTARRRQRAIPVIREPDNKSLEFTELIGTLYCRRENHAELVCKKFTYFAELLRRHIQVDVEDASDDDALSRRIALKTGLKEEQIRILFHNLRPVIRSGRGVSEEQMKAYIDRMNEIINHL